MLRKYGTKWSLDLGLVGDSEPDDDGIDHVIATWTVGVLLIQRDERFRWILCEDGCASGDLVVEIERGLLPDMCLFFGGRDHVTGSGGWLLGGLFAAVNDRLCRITWMDFTVEVLRMGPC